MTADAPEPTITTSLFLYKVPSQVTQYETPFFIFKFSSTGSFLGVLPDAITINLKLYISSLVLTIKSSFSFLILKTSLETMLAPNSSIALYILNAKVEGDFSVKPG